MFRNILLSNIDIKSTNKSYRKLITVNLFYLVTLSTLIIFSPINFFIRDNYLAGVIEFLFLFPLLYGFFELRKNKNIEKNSIYATVMLFFMLLTLIFFFRFEEYTVIWALLFPFMAINLGGVRVGLIFVIVFNLIIYIGAYYFWQNSDAPFIEFMRIVIVSIIISLLVYFYEKNILESFDNQRTLNESLVKRVKELRKLSITDSLTKLFNKRHFDTVMCDEFNRAKRANAHFTLAILDIDNFKLYNDTYGHDKGNEALVKVGEILNEQTARSGDYAFRIGGEEFAIVLQSDSPNDISAYFDKLREKIVSEKIIHIKNGPSGFLTVSIGIVSVSNYELVSIMDAYRIADKKLYEVKKNGRNSIEVIII